MVADAWITGIRREQSWTRAEAPIIDIQDGRIKLHPVVDWKIGRVIDYYRKHALPYHPQFGSDFNRNAGSSVNPLLQASVPRECGLHVRLAEMEKTVLGKKRGDLEE